MRNNKIYDSIIENAVKYSINEAFSDLYQWEHFDNDFSDDNGDDDYDEAIDAYTLSEVLKKHGWSYYDSLDWTDKKTGKKYVKYMISKDRNNTSDVKTVFNSIKKSAEYPNGIHLAEGNYIQAPEMKRFSIYVEKIYPDGQQMSLSFENTMKKKITIKESELRHIVENIVRKQLIREDAYDDAYDSLAKQSTLKKIAVNFVNKAGYKTWKDNNENYFTFNVEVSSMKDEEIIVNGLRKALKVKPEYAGELRGNYETRLGGSNAYVTIYLPSWNKCNLNL